MRTVARAGRRGALQRRRPPLRAARVPRGAHVPPRHRRRRSRRGRRALRRDGGRASRRALAGAAAGRVGAHGGPPLRRPELGGRGRRSRAGADRRAAALAALRARFEDEHERLYGVTDRAGSPVEVRAVRLAALGDAATTHFASRRRSERRRLDTAPLGGSTRATAPVRTRVVDRRGAGAGPAARRRVRHHRRRPAGLVAPGATPPPGRSSWSAMARLRARVDPVTLQIVGNALASIADEMATTICRTAHSTVVRDGMDFSAVVCDAQGPDGRAGGQRALPPRLDPGRDGDAASSTTATGCRPGDVFVMNDPFDGGMHLQDIFVFKPVHLERRADRLHLHDRASRRRRRPAARLERLRQHRDLPGGDPDALAAPLRRGRAGRGRLQADRGERADPADDLRRPRRAGRGLLRRRAGAGRTRRAARTRSRSRS